MQGCVISCGTVVFFQISRNLSRSLLTNNNFYCARARSVSVFPCEKEKKRTQVDLLCSVILNSSLSNHWTKFNQRVTSTN